MKDKLSELAISLAKSYGYHTAVYLGEYEGNMVYKPLYLDKKKRWTGYPKFFIQKNERLIYFDDIDFILTKLFEEQIIFERKKAEEEYLAPIC